MEQEQATLRRRWRSRPDPIAGVRPMVFHADADDLHVASVHVFESDGGVALSFITNIGSVNVLLPPQLAHELGHGLLRLTATSQPGLASAVKPAASNQRSRRRRL
jgi:hypothetical protein